MANGTLRKIPPATERHELTGVGANETWGPKKELWKFYPP